MRVRGGEAFVLNRFLEGQRRDRVLCGFGRARAAWWVCRPGAPSGRVLRKGLGGSCGLGWGVKDQGLPTLICMQGLGCLGFPRILCERKSGRGGQ